MAPADRLSLRTNPCQPIWVRSRPLTAAADNEAGPVVSPGTEAFATITAETAGRVAPKAGSAPAWSWESARVEAGP